MKDESLLRALGTVAKKQRAAPDIVLSAAEEQSVREHALKVLLSGAGATPRRPNAWLWLSAGVAGLAVAASVALTLQVSPASPLPGYESAFEGGQRATRGEPAPETTPEQGVAIPPGGHFGFNLRPRTPVAHADALGARAFVRNARGVQELQARLELSEEGAARLAGSRESVFRGVAPGEWTLILVVGRKSELKGEPAALVEQLRAPNSRVRFAERKIILPRE
jgi:hypothetical protein